MSCRPLTFLAMSLLPTLFLAAHPPKRQKLEARPAAPPAAPAAPPAGAALPAGTSRPLTSLPDDVLANAGSFLEEAELVRLMATGRSFYRLGRGTILEEVRAQSAETVVVDLARRPTRDFRGFRDLSLVNFDTPHRPEAARTPNYHNLVALRIQDPVGFLDLQPFLLCPNLRTLELRDRLEHDDPARENAFFDRLEPGRQLAIRSFSMGDPVEQDIDVDLRRLLRHLPLQELHLGGCSLAEANNGTFGAHVLEALPGLGATLQRLTLNINSMTEAEFLRLCGTLEALPNLAYLELVDVHQSDAFAAAASERLGAVLAGLRHLECVELSGLPDVPARHALLRLPPSVTTLLHGYELDPATWRLILERLPKLEVLQIHAGNFSAEELLALGGRLAAQECFKALRLRFEDDPGPALTEQLRQNLAAAKKDLEIL